MDSPSGEYTVVARRYRPQGFDQLVGQDGISRALANAIKANRVAHAYLFTGARGVGKTSTARILAKSLNCVTGPTPTPCNACESCRAVAAGEDIDVLEIDGASNRGVDDVRDIRANVLTRPTKSRYKIYIIDEVHMLTKEAFNALLKTLEEPPPHVKFIFATTEVHKIPITILSRCQRFDFAGIGTQKITDRLRLIVETEHRSAEPEALKLVARRAGGSMRDAQSLLDQLLAFSGDTVTAAAVHQLLGTAGEERVLGLARAVVTNDALVALQQINTFAEAGLQLGELLDQLIDLWRELMLFSAGGDAYLKDHSNYADSDAIRRLSQSLTLDAVLAGLEVLTSTKTRMRAGAHPQVLLEMAAVRLCRLGDLVPLAQLAEALRNGVPQGGELLGSRPAPSTARVAPPEPAPAVGLSLVETMQMRSTPANGHAAKATIVAAKPATRPAPAPSPAMPRSTPLDENTLAGIWERLIEDCGMVMGNHLRRIGLPAICGPNALAVVVPRDYNAAYQYLTEEGQVPRLEAIVRRVTGESWRIRVEKGEANGAAPIAPPPAARKEFLDSPLIKALIDKAGASILKADDQFGLPPEKVGASADPE